MKIFRFSCLRRLTVAVVSSICILLVLWLISPLLPILAKPQTKIFEQVWQTVNDNFYDTQFNGVNWKAIREKYKPQIVQLKSNEGLTTVINQMLSELQTSHTRFYTQYENHFSSG
ncbi:hypothetical protein [Nostoc mirabile]|uniref:hypothetical protein n=1 Tax=Nostoc mirabile TaxID=2907820 RepID=UPI003555F9EF